MSELETKDIEFLKTYNADEYKHPSVTVDIVILTVNNNDKLSVLLIQRSEEKNIFGGKWAIPGGFVDVEEDIDAAARRELKEEIGLENIHIEQLYTFGKVDRDPRTRVISIAYMALVPKNLIEVAKAGDDAQDVKLFEINDTTLFNKTVGEIPFKDLAFDHKEILKTAIGRLKNRIEYTDDAFDLLEDRSNFTIYEYRKLLELIEGKEISAGNFANAFIKNYVNSGRVEPTGNITTKHSLRPAKSYRKVC